MKISNKTLIGFNAELDFLSKFILKSNIPNCLILSGAKDSTLKQIALNFANYLVENNNFDKSLEIIEILRNKSSISSPYILLIERVYLEDKKKFKKIISREDVSYIHDFFATKNDPMQKRICIINSLDEMSKEAVNSLLKVIEEPNHNSHFIIINHQQNLLLPTIKSRSFVMNFKIHGNVQFSKIIKNEHPETNDKDIMNLFNLSKGSISFTKKFLHHNSIEMSEHLSSILIDPDKIKYNTPYHYIEFLKNSDDLDGSIEFLFNLIALKINELCINACKVNNHALIKRLTLYYYEILRIKKSHITFNLNINHAMIAYFYFLKNA